MRRSEALPAHHIALDGTRDWSIWRTIFVRGAGFESRGVLALATPPLARAADALLDGEAAFEAERARAIGECIPALEASAGVERKALAKVLSALRQGRVPEGPPALAEALDRARRALQGVVAARDAVQAAFLEASAAVRAATRVVASDPRFQEAVIWQNRTGFELGVEWLLKRPADASDDKTRQKERLVANYLQRYTVKNDTIGFFGPVGWGQVVPEGAALEVRPGPSLLAKRTVYFEHWAIDALADCLAADLDVRMWLAPRRMPSLRVEGSVLVDPERLTTTELEPLEAFLLAAVDGETPARAIARRLVQAGTPELPDEAAVYAGLDRLVSKKWLIWRLEIPVMKSQPDAQLARALARVESASVRERGQRLLAEMEAPRAGIARAAGDPRGLREALGALEETFVRLTGRAASRNHGKVYASRTLVYEDCRRDMELRVGPELMARLGPPLGLLLDSARWYTYTIAARCREAFRDIYVALGGTASRGVGYLAFETRVFEHLPISNAQQQPLVRQIADTLRARWAEVLGLQPGDRRVQRSVAEVSARAAEAFAAPCAGWPTARFHSPDLMLAARSVEAVARGEYLIVMGELHTGLNTVLSNLALDQHPDPDALVRARSLDIPPSPLPVPPRTMAGTRALSQSPSPNDYNIEFDDSRSWRARDHVVAAADLVVQDEGGRLRVRTLDGGLDFDVVEAFQVLMMGSCAPHFRIAPPWRHVPRVTLDVMVIVREGWTFSPEDFAFVHEEDRLGRFVGARRWARAHGLPRFVFVKTPEELKPWYLDLESPAFVELFAWGARRASSLRVTEMLPGIDETWLPDAQGRTYTSELRIVAVDPARWAPDK